MADFWITFRLKDGASYDSRLKALYEAADAASSKWWLEATSFIVLRTNLSTDALGTKLKAAIDPRVDLVLLRQIGKNDTRYAGVIEDDEFHDFFPEAKKL